MRELVLDSVSGLWSNLVVMFGCRRLFSLTGGVKLTKSFKYTYNELSAVIASVAIHAIGVGIGWWNVHLVRHLRAEQVDVRDLRRASGIPLSAPAVVVGCCYAIVSSVTILYRFIVNLYGIATNFYGRVTNLYGRVTKLHGIGAILYGKGLNLHGKGSVLYGIVTAFYGIASILYRIKSNLYRKATNLYEFIVNLYGKVIFPESFWFILTNNIYKPCRFEGILTNRVIYAMRAVLYRIRVCSSPSSLRSEDPPPKACIYIAAAIASGMLLGIPTFPIYYKRLKIKWCALEWRRVM